MNQQNKTQVIAEVGVNHNGDFQIALKMIDEASKANADIVKFQTISKETTYNFAKDDNDVFSFVANSQFSKEQYKKIIARCYEKNITFMTSVADVPALDLMLELGIKDFKISSANSTNFHLLSKVSKNCENLIISTGMSSMNEIEETYSFLKKMGMNDKQITMLYCVSKYPATYDDINLDMIEILKNKFPGIGIGFSDHTEGTLTSIVAAAKGASIIEKHFTLDNSWEGPDQAFSLTPPLLLELTDAINLINNQNKITSLKDESSKSILRRSMYANKEIKKDKLICFDDIAAKRPFENSGILPIDFEQIVGKKSKIDLDINDLILKENLYD